MQKTALAVTLGLSLLSAVGCTDDKTEQSTDTGAADTGDAGTDEGTPDEGTGDDGTPDEGAGDAEG